MSGSQKRVPNFTNSEKALLLRIIANKYANIVENKKTDRVSSLDKDKVWNLVEKDFNASSNNTTYRNSVSLKKCYENRKKELRKAMAEERKQVLLTGGGPPPTTKTDNTEDILLSIMNKKTLVGLNNRYDDDGEEFPILPMQDEEVFELDIQMDVGNDIQEETQTRNVIASTSRKSDDPETASAENFCNITSQQNNWKKCTPKQLQKPTSAPLVVSEYNESGSNDNKISNKSRRRPTTIVKPLTSSDVANKYNILLDKRLQLVDGQLKHMERENARVIEKLDLEIAILKIKLNKEKSGNNTE